MFVVFTWLMVCGILMSLFGKISDNRTYFIATYLSLFTYRLIIVAFLGYLIAMATISKYFRTT